MSDSNYNNSGKPPGIVIIFGCICIYYVISIIIDVIDMIINQFLR